MFSEEQKKKREVILGVVGTKYPIAGTEKFGSLSLARFERLVSEGFITLRDHDTYKRFISFMKKNSLFRAHGYVVSPERSDSRVVIQGLEAATINRLNHLSVQEFKELFADADNLTTENNRYNCFYDYDKKAAK
jgi:hypothetical protein